MLAKSSLMCYGDSTRSRRTRSSRQLLWEDIYIYVNICASSRYVCAVHGLRHSAWESFSFELHKQFEIPPPWSFSIAFGYFFLVSLKIVYYVSNFEPDLLEQFFSFSLVGFWRASDAYASGAAVAVRRNFCVRILYARARACKLEILAEEVEKCLSDRFESASSRTIINREINSISNLMSPLLAFQIDFPLCGLVESPISNSAVVVYLEWNLTIFML